ncbi:TonB-dependent receptor [Sphingobium sp. HBC34]|uniref:TonB-dependent receptor n=1 Tax=Sphingobium cyanobacteriorum TaxID=3063954 RepID=A0ABT8ZJU8_9SPHN|nr:TonB-dependent receptor [Sphingobium sp. HBC34]MDO7834807.1 TonB-dependent receptor [Sphingobium sp. HBC34]
MKDMLKVLLLCSAAMPAAAIAQSNPAPATPAVTSAGIDEIIVTAQKREQNLQKVPIAITALTAQALQAKGINTLSDLVSVPPPGLSAQPFAGAAQSLIFDMRGISNPDPTQGTAELGVAIYLDDVYLGRSQGLGTELSDPERIEVLRGPQGTLFGRNAEGGAVRIVTSKPTGEFGGRVKLGIGNYGQRRYEAHINLPEIAGFAVKIDYLDTNLDGYTKNGTARVAGLAQQRDFGALDNRGYRVSVRWKPVDGATIDYAYDNAKTESVGDWHVLVAPNPVPPGFVLPATYRNKARGIESISKRTDTSYAPMFNEPFIVKTQGHTLTAQYEVSDDITVKSITAWRRVRSSGSQTLNGAYSLVPFEFTPGLNRPLPAAALRPDPRFGALGTVDSTASIYAVTGVVPYAELRQNQFSQELQLIGSTDTLEWVVGGYFFRERVTDNRQTFFNGVFLDSGKDGAFTDFVGTNPFSLPFPNQGASNQSARSRSYAAFAQFTWTPDFADGRLHITPGVRYTNDRKTAARTLFGGLPVGPINRLFEEKRFDPAMTIAYDVAPTVNAYARYAQAYRAGGAGIRDPKFGSFGAEVNKAYELGLKSSFMDRRVILNLSAFRNEISGRQLTVQVSPTDPAATATINVPGSAPVKGLEAELTISPARGLTLGATYAHLTGTLPADRLAGIDPTANFFIPNLPRNSGTVTFDYLSPDLGNARFAFHMDYSWADAFNSTVRVPKNSYAHPMKRNVANARISLQDIEVGPTNFMISYYMKNIFDTAYPVFTAPGSMAILSPPRTYGLEATMRF